MPVQTSVQIDVSAFQSFYPSTMSDFVENAKSVMSKAQQKTNEAIQTLREKVQETPLSPMVTKTYSVTTQVEMAFNIAACLPLIGTAFSWLRILSGKIQVVAGAAIMVGGKAGYFISKFGQANELTLNKWKIIANFGAENVLHGCLNILRGLGETLIGAATLGFGSVSLLIPNLIIREPFAPAVKYGEFIQPDLSDNGSEVLKEPVSGDDGFFNIKVKSSMESETTKEQNIQKPTAPVATGESPISISDSVIL
jgi:hypothetical protein